MKEYRVEILPRAEEDLRRNSRWWAENHDAAQAVTWFRAVREQILGLKHFPESHGLSAENEKFPFEIRDRLIGSGSRPSYRAVFTIRDEKVLVLAVLRASEDALSPNDIDI